MSTELFDFNYHLIDAKISEDENVVVVASTEFVNSNKEGKTVEVEFPDHGDTGSSSWKADLIDAGTKTMLRKVCIPFIRNGEIKVSTKDQFDGEYKWASVVESQVKGEELAVPAGKYTITVPPLSRVKVSLVATKAAFSVPFSCSINTDLNNPCTKLEDGIYTGTSSVGFFYATELMDEH